MAYNLKRIFFIALFVLFTAAACQPTIRFASDDNSSKSAKEDVKTSTTPQVAVKKTTQSQQKKSTISNPNKNIKIITIAESWLGVSYKYAGNDKNGVDCSGFVKNVYNEAGINLPRTSAEQYLVAIPTENPEIGDLVFFKKQNRIYHVGIYAGNNQMIHASTSKGVIKQSLNEKLFISTHTGFGKINY